VDLGKTFERNLDRYVEEWKRLLSFPSVSTDPAHDADCSACAEWLARHLSGIGFAARLLPTRSKPCVYAQRPGAAGLPTVLFYGHYDVQPADPVGDWVSPPFEPAMRDGRLYARGASDNKGQHFCVLKALEALVREDALRVPVRILLEGEEESGSAGATAALEEWKDLLRADVLMVTDVHMSPSGAPAITMGLRGVFHMTVVVEGAPNDLHSGEHGGVAPNPAAELARLVASLRAPDGGIAVPGFCDGMLPATETERALAAAGAITPEAYRELTGVPPTGGETAYPPAERAGFRPSIDVNGLLSGYTGAGMKTIIPASAMAKLTGRVTAGQDPAACLEALRRHLERSVGPGLRLSIPQKGVSGSGFRLPVESPLVKTAMAVLARVAGAPPVLQWGGASIPIVSALARVSGARPLLAGFGAEEDRIHAPNESFSLRQFRLGFLYAAELLGELAAAAPR
jgi:acetylornithine deacetylase/succinyl-diaminopimelate desuccinylase-like protein